MRERQSERGERDRGREERARQLGVYQRAYGLKDDFTPVYLSLRIEIGWGHKAWCDLDFQIFQLVGSKFKATWPTKTLVRSTLSFSFFFFLHGNNR